VAAPTTGNIRIAGRVASLLEVGTGMHPELTGRENIYLNGAILGMRRREIGRKLDAIVDFAGVARYLDTPVKRYSSGMHVRLGFAVAAHLDPEILIVDEVLAVGDAEFQRKCLGKMKEVSTNEGRTVLFVSHNMHAINSLTSRCLIIQHGALAFNGPTPEALGYYLRNHNEGETEYRFEPLPDAPKIVGIRLNTSSSGNIHTHGEPLSLEIDINFPRPLSGLALSIQVLDNFDNPIIHTWVYDHEIPFGHKKGINHLVCNFPKLRLYLGNFYINFHFSGIRPKHTFEKIERICSFEVDMRGIERFHQWSANACNYLEDTHWMLKSENTDIAEITG
jgi:lipopolysaccharide transport system ATP-binding protein